MKLKDLSMELHEVMMFPSTKRSRHLVTAYYPNVGKIEQVGISIGDRCEINIDHLPRTGYSISTYYAEDYGEKIVILKNVKVLDFKESLFIDEDQIVRMAFLSGGDMHDVMVDIVPSGVNGRRYCVTHSCGHKDFFSLFQYGKSFVFLKRSEENK